MPRDLRHAAHVDHVRRPGRKPPYEGKLVAGRPLNAPVPMIAVAVYPRWSYDRGILRGIAEFTAGPARFRHVVLPEPADDSAGILRNSAAFSIAGVIGAEGPVLDLAISLGLPCVCVTGVARQFPAPRVLSDDVRIGREIARHLLDQGYRRLGFLDYRRFTWFGRQRWHGFRAAAVAAGVECHRFAATPTLSPSFAPDSRRLDRYLDAFIRRGGGGPAAVMASTDHLGVEAIAAAARVGLRVPEDLAVVGVDDNDVVFESCVPALTSLGQHTDRIGYTAATLLSRLIAGDGPVPQLTLVEPGELIVRRSSDHMVISDRLVAAALQQVRDPETVIIKVETIAARLGVSRKTLDERFKAVIGRTPAAEVRRLQVERARRLLLTSDLSIGDVAAAAGFSSAQQLSETFHRETGLTPTDCRRRSRASSMGR
ncbi:MAG TPA: substrate-binding domain-containing protein [Tepidisphaeraceae bacterium]|jgi:LacI family transcriptional regulator|nr:substrate-binding domain-containing protein [Tepidisphaeraceae bacterium]